MLDREPQPQALHGHPPVFRLTPPLVCLRSHARWPVFQHDRRFHFVAVLPSGPAATRARLLAHRKKILI